MRHDEGCLHQDILRLQVLRRRLRYREDRIRLHYHRRRKYTGTNTVPQGQDKDHEELLPTLIGYSIDYDRQPITHSNHSDGKHIIELKSPPKHPHRPNTQIEREGKS